MNESAFKNKGDIVNYGKEKSLLQEGEQPEQIIAKLKVYEKEFGYNKFKAKALEAIIDSLDRKKRGKNPASTGKFDVESVRAVVPEEKGSANPREYLDMVLREFADQTALETEFIENFIKNNPNLDDKAKKFMITTVASQIGPWFLRHHVVTVRDLVGFSRFFRKI
jgi:hypothetical protein